jgi:hypothetical protein
VAGTAFRRTVLRASRKAFAPSHPAEGEALYCGTLFRSQQPALKKQPDDLVLSFVLLPYWVLFLHETKHPGAQVVFYPRSHL